MTNRKNKLSILEDISKWDECQTGAQARVKHLVLAVKDRHTITENRIKYNKCKFI